LDKLLLHSKYESNQLKLLKEIMLKVYKIHLLMASVFIIGINTTGNAQTVADTLHAELDTIRIKATHSSITIGRAPMALSYINRQSFDIDSRRAFTMNEIVSTLPGIQISNRENYALGERMTIRGMGWRSQFGLRGVQVVLDDVPLTVADGQTILNMADPAMIQKVELLRGPSATFWGNSSGGVLHLSTIPPADSPKFRYRGLAGSYETLKQELQFSGSFGDVKVSGYGSYFETDGYRDHSAARMIRSGITGAYDLNNDTRVQVHFSYSGMPLAQHPGSLTLDDSINESTKAMENFVNTKAGKNFDQIMGAASLYRDFKSGFMTFTLHGVHRDLENPLPFGFISVDRYAGGGRLTYDWQNLPFDLQTGVEYKFQRDNRLETDNINGESGNNVDVRQLETVSNQAVFGRISIPFGNLSLSGGLRGDRLIFSADDRLGTGQDGDREFISFNPSIGFTYDFRQARLYANISTSFESPTTTELVNRPEGGNGFNQNVDPERAISFETGVRGSGWEQRINYDFAIYLMQISNLIFPYQTDPLFVRNEGESIHYGFESRVELRPLSFLQLIMMYNYIHAEFTDGTFDGNTIPGVSPHRGTLQMWLIHGNQRFGADAEWIYSTFTNSANTAENDSYIITNARWLYNGISVRNNIKLKPFASVSNIFNTRYNSSIAINAFGGRFFEPGSNRAIQAGIVIEFQ
jgi:iron complex outermembrane receptor protein